jgi:hypothetical protein
MSYVDVVPPPKPPVDAPDDVHVTEIGDPPSLKDYIPPDDHERESDEEALARARRLFTKIVTPCWADYVAAEEEAQREKMARLRAARLAIPPTQRSPKGAGSEPKEDPPKLKPGENVEEVGDWANVRQNTTAQVDKK